MILGVMKISSSRLVFVRAKFLKMLPRIGIWWRNGTRSRVTESSVR